MGEEREIKEKNGGERKALNASCVQEKKRKEVAQMTLEVEGVNKK